MIIINEENPISSRIVEYRKKKDAEERAKNEKLATMIQAKRNAIIRAKFGERPKSRSVGKWIARGSTIGSALGGASGLAVGGPMLAAGGIAGGGITGGLIGGALGHIAKSHRNSQQDEYDRIVARYKKKKGWA